MAARDEWTDWHLTPRGWEAGSKQVEIGVLIEQAPPVDRVLTYRWFEVASCMGDPIRAGHELTWESSDHAAIESLRTRFGKPPATIPKGRV